MATTRSETDAALEQARQGYEEVDRLMRSASPETLGEWHALQDRWTRFCEDCDRAATDEPSKEQLAFSIRLVAEEFDKTFRRIAEACR